MLLKVSALISGLIIFSKTLTYSPLFGDHGEPTRVANVLEIEQPELLLLNTERASAYIRLQGESVADLYWVLSEDVRCIFMWRVIEEFETERPHVYLHGNPSEIQRQA